MFYTIFLLKNSIKHRIGYPCAFAGIDFTGGSPVQPPIFLPRSGSGRLWRLLADAKKIGRTKRLYHPWEGTAATTERGTAMNGVSSITVSEDVALVSFKKIPHDLALLADIFGRISDAGIVIDMISQTSPLSGNVSISFSCPGKDMVGMLKATNTLSGAHAQLKPLVSSGNCKIQLAGEEMRDAHGVFARALKCLAAAKSELLQVTTSEVEISLLLPASHLEDAVTALKREFALQ